MLDEIHLDRKAGKVFSFALFSATERTAEIMMGSAYSIPELGNIMMGLSRAVANAAHIAVDPDGIVGHLLRLVTHS